MAIIINQQVITESGNTDKTVLIIAIEIQTKIIRIYRHRNTATGQRTHKFIQLRTDATIFRKLTDTLQAKQRTNANANS